MTPFPYSLDTPDGFFNKSNKAVIRHFLAKQLPHEDERWLQSGCRTFLQLLTRSLTKPIRRRFYITCRLHVFVYQLFRLNLKKFMNFFRTRRNDTRVILHLKHLESLCCPAAIIRTPNTDILIINLLHAHAFSKIIMLDIGSGKHRQVMNVTSLSGKLGCDYC